MSEPALSTESIRQALGPPFGNYEIEVLDRVSSTNEVARERSAAGRRDPYAVAAESQTSGKGRGSNTWFSPPGTGIYFSLLFKPLIKKEHYPLLNLMAGVAVAEGIEKATAILPDIKWPNDLLLDGKKLGGILIEGGKGGRMILGVGLNIHTRQIPEELTHRATSLALHSPRKAFDRNSIIAALITSFHQWNLAALEYPAALINRWKSLCVTFGRCVEGRDGLEAVKGIARDIDSNGYLLVEKEDGTEGILRSYNPE